MVKKVVIDCDAGMDDASALFMATRAHKTKAIELVAITTTHGNTSLYVNTKRKNRVIYLKLVCFFRENVVRNVARTLTASSLSDVSFNFPLERRLVYLKIVGL